MKAYRLKRTGKPQVLKIEDVPEPEPGRGEVKVKVKAIGINYAEILSRKGQYSWAPKKPYVLGMEGVGEVIELGEGTSKYRIGDQVIIGKQYGTYAEFTCAPEHLCFPAFEKFSDEENAAYLVNFMTAWVALKKLCRVTQGERVLIQAAAGGVGTAAVQIAKAMGCKVYGTASKSDKLELINKLGGIPVNYHSNDFYEVITEDGGPVDAVLETVGGQVFKKSMKLLAPFGRLVVIGFASMNLKIWNPVSWIKTYIDAPKVNIMKMAMASTGVHASHIGYLTENAGMTEAVWEELKEFVDRNSLKPVVGRTFSFENLAEAHAFMESRNSMGKLVVKIG